MHKINTHNRNGLRSLQPFGQDYGLAFHTTHVVYVFMREWRDHKRNINIYNITENCILGVHVRNICLSYVGSDIYENQRSEKIALYEYCTNFKWMGFCYANDFNDLLRIDFTFLNSFIGIFRLEIIQTGLLAQFLTPLMLCVLILYIIGATYSLKSTPNYRFFLKNFSWQILFTLLKFLSDVCLDEG